MAAVLARGQVQSFYFCRTSPFWTKDRLQGFLLLLLLHDDKHSFFVILFTLWPLYMDKMMDSTCSQGRATPPSHLPIIKCFTEREVDSVSFSFQAIIIQQPVLLAEPPLRGHVSQRNHRVLEEGGR